MKKTIVIDTAVITDQLNRARDNSLNLLIKGTEGLTKGLKNMKSHKRLDRKVAEAIAGAFK